MSKMKEFSNAVNRGMIRARIGLDSMTNSFRNKMAEKRKGAVSFEYIIIVVIMVGILMAAFAFLRPLIEDKIEDIGNAITNTNIGVDGVSGGAFGGNGG